MKGSQFQLVYPYTKPPFSQKGMNFSMQQNNPDIQLLNDIYKNSQMGRKTLEEITELTEDTKFLEVLQKHRDWYTQLNDEASILLRSHGEEPKGTGMWDDVSASLMIKVNTLTDRSPSHLAQMLVQGSSMGIVDIQKQLNQQENTTDQNILKLAKKLLDGEEKNVETLKKFL